MSQETPFLPENDYEQSQARGDRSAYERYLRGMDASMRQKVALTAAHLLCEGQVADMGMGSGQGSFALASLYPRLQVIGVDIDATTVELARARHVLDNLRFVEGDIATAVFPPEALDGIFDSSVLHHVTSYGGYLHENATNALRAQVAQLKPHGILVVRDFLDPGPLPVWLDLPTDDGDEGHDPKTASTARLLELFARQFRSLSANPGFPLERVDSAIAGAASAELVPPPRVGFRRYALSHKLAAEFVLRKDYREDWHAELKEEYTYFTQAQFEALFASLGLRVLASLPLMNPWILRHRFRDRFELRDRQGHLLPFPATNFLIVGEKVGPGEGVRFGVTEETSGTPGFLRLEHHRHRQTGRVFDLAARPHVTVDVIPYFHAADTVYVLARASYPRPLLATAAQRPIDDAGPVTYVVEPLNVLQTDRPLGATVEQALARAGGVKAEQIRRMLPGTTYYPSPGGILEEVRSIFVEIDPVYVNQPLESVSGFSSSGRLRAIEARQLLRAAQVGGLPDARLDLNVRQLLRRLGLSEGPWIGEEVTLPRTLPIVARPAFVLLEGPARRQFSISDQSAGFLRIRRVSCTEQTADGRVVGSQVLELVEPTPLSLNTVAVAVLTRAPDGRVLLGVDLDDLPAAQLFTGNSNLPVAPAWRLPHSVEHLDDARAFARERLLREYGVSTGECWELGGAYHPSPGLTPERVFPLAFEVSDVSESNPSGAKTQPLYWVPLDELVATPELLRDGHLCIVALRAAHALQVG